MSRLLRLLVPHLMLPSNLPVYLCEKNCFTRGAQYGATPHWETAQAATKRSWSRKSRVEGQAGWNRLFKHDLLVGCHGSAELNRQRNQRINTLVEKGELNFKDTAFLPSPQWTDATWSTRVYVPLYKRPQPHNTLRHSPLNIAFMH